MGRCLEFALECGRSTRKALSYTNDGKLASFCFDSSSTTISRELVEEGELNSKNVERRIGAPLASPVWSGYPICCLLSYASGAARPLVSSEGGRKWVDPVEQLSWSQARQGGSILGAWPSVSLDDSASQVMALLHGS